MQIDDDKLVKDARAAMLRKPAAPVYTEEQRALQRRIRHAENKPDIEAANKERAMLGDLERQCVAFGEQPLNLAPVVLEDMTLAELRSYRVTLQRWITGCRDVVAYHLEKKAEAERAAETPDQRAIRELQAEVAELKAHSANMSSAPRHDPSAADFSPMPFAQTNGLPPGAGPPPRVAARSMRNAAHPIGCRVEQSPVAFAMTNVVQAGRETSSPADFVAAMRG
jgi:hypothetical protein